MLTLYSFTISSANSFLTSGSRVFFDDVLQNLVIQSQLSIHLLQFAVFLLKLLESADLTDLHAAVLALPIVQYRFGNAVIAGNCLGIDAAFQLLNGLHHLTFCVYFSFHRRKSNDFCLIQICTTNWEGYKKGKLTLLFYSFFFILYLINILNNIIINLFSI